MQNLSVGGFSILGNDVGLGGTGTPALNLAPTADLGGSLVKSSDPKAEEQFVKDLGATLKDSLKSVEQVLEVFRGHREANRPHLLCGDFNANAPYQRIDPARCKPSASASVISSKYQP